MRREEEGRRNRGRGKEKKSDELKKEREGVKEKKNQDKRADVMIV